MQASPSRSHFTDKDALFKAGIADKCEQLAPPESFLRLAEVGPQEALTQIAENFVRLMSNTDVLAMHRVVIGEAANNPRIAQLFYEAGPERFKTGFIALLHRFNEHRELHTPDALVACDQFFHMLKGDLPRAAAAESQAEADAGGDCGLCTGVRGAVFTGVWRGE